MSKKFPGFNLTNLYSEFSFERIAMHLSFLQGFFASWTDVGFNIPSWSISVEFWTYAVFAACCIGLRTRTVAAQCLLAVACLSLLYLWPDLGQSRWYNMMRSVLGFSVGSVAYSALTTLSYNRISRITATVLEAFVIMQVVILFSVVPATFGAATHSELGASVREGFWLIGLSPLIFMQVVIVFSVERGVISEMLKRGMFHSLGTYSYSIYMDHAIFISLFKIGMDAIGRTTGISLGTSMMAGSIVVLLFLCNLWWISRWTYYNIERPGQIVLPGVLRGLVSPKLANRSRYSAPNSGSPTEGAEKI
jgi:peptidoglycan/LPS O-acetylase OafA/YrhL